MNTTCPHTRGDDPISELQTLALEDLSPYAWG